MARLNYKLTNEEKEQLERTFDTGRIYMAEVMDTRSVSKSGDLMVYLIGSDLNKNDERNWVHASYASNFYGTTPYEPQSDSTYENSPQSFGQWFPMPCVGNFVFVFFPVSSAENSMCYWFACPINPFTNYMLPGIPGKSDTHEPLCERNDKCCTKCNKKNDEKSFVNENKVDGNTVNNKNLPNDEKAKKVQQIINQYNFSEEDMTKIVNKFESYNGKYNINDIGKYISQFTINKSNGNYGQDKNNDIGSILISAYMSGSLNLDNLNQYYNQSQNIDQLSNETDESTSGSCSNNILKQKQYYGNGIKESEKIQAKYEPLAKALKEQGLDKDGTRGYSTAGAKRESPSMCYGIKTPLGNTFVMDDGWLDSDNKTTWKWKLVGGENLDNNGDIKQARKLVGNGGLSPWQRKPGTKDYDRKDAGFRLRTRNGTQILIADEGTVYMINRDGSCWVEMTKNGFLEGYSKKGVAISSDGDINLHTSRNIYMECDETLAIKAKKINIETNAGKGTDKDAVGGDINIAKTAHINTNAVISANEVYARRGKIDTFESKAAKIIGRFAGTFYGVADIVASFFFNDVNGMDKKRKPVEVKKAELLDIPSVEDPQHKLLINPKEEEKVDVDGQGTSESDNKKIEETINTKITTHEPYFGHCKYTPKKSDKEKEEKEKKEQEQKEKEKEEAQEKENKDNNTQKAQEKDAKTNCGQVNNNCSGCNTSSGCSGCSGSSAPTTSCSGCGGVSNQCDGIASKDISNAVVNKQFINEKISKNYNLSDLIKSKVATANNIQNAPTNSKIKNNLTSLSVNILERLKEQFPNLEIISCYRSEELNNIMNGSINSPHLTGQAVDVKVPGMTTQELAEYIQKNLVYDQVVLENYTPNNPNSGWVHVSYNANNNRRQALTVNTDQVQGILSKG